MCNLINLNFIKDLKEFWQLVFLSSLFSRRTIFFFSIDALCTDNALIIFLLVNMYVYIYTYISIFILPCLINKLPSRALPNVFYFMFFVSFAEIERNLFLW